MDAIRFIINEHKRFKSQFASVNKSTRSDAMKSRMFKKLCQELVRHETMEEKKWYPHFKNDAKLKPIVKHLIREEKSASKKIKAFKKLKFNINWQKQFPAFRKAVLAHAADEEKKLFPKVRKVFEKSELQKIGQTLKKFKANYKTS